MRRLVGLAHKMAIIAVSFSVVWVLFYRFVPVPFTNLMIQRTFEDFSFNPVRYSWTSYKNINDKIKVSALASEDQLFPFHGGVDIASMRSAIFREGRKNIRGASTITQQVAKNAFLWPARSYVRKVAELYFTILIESLWTKERILEVYLNIAEMGDHVFGVKAASSFFYSKKPSQLTLKNAALLIGALPNPVKYNVALPGRYLQKRSQQVSYLYNTLDGPMYLREMYLRTSSSLYDFRKYKQH